MRTKDTLTLRIKNDLCELERVARALSDFIKKHRLPAPVLNSVDLALEEVLTNIIFYGYRDQESHCIDIRIFLRDKQILVEVEDDGQEFNPLTVPQPDTESAIAERPVGGLGVHLVRCMMDEIRYHYKNRRNCLILVKKFKEV